MRSWADDFNTYDEACEYYGCDTPSQVKAEMEADAEEERLEMIEMEKAFGPYVFPYFLFPNLYNPNARKIDQSLNDDFPF